MIRVLVIPAEIYQPIQVREVDPTLENYQALVGGYIEAVSLQKPYCTLFCNEEGKLMGLDYNARATEFFWDHQGDALIDDYIAGDAFVCGPPNWKGQETSVPPVLEALADES